VNAMDNARISDLLQAMAWALEFLEENPFKAKAYQKAARSIAGLAVPVKELIESGDILRVEGIGASIASLLTTWVKENDFSALDSLREKIPEGLEEMTRVSGLGLKKIRVLYADLGITDLDQLLAAIDQGRLEGLKGFSRKGIDKIREAVLAVIACRGWHLLDEAWSWAQSVCSLLEEAGLEVVPTGECRRGMETIYTVDILVQAGRDDTEKRILQRLGSIPGVTLSSEPGVITAIVKNRPCVRVVTVLPERFIPALFITTGSAEHVGRVCDALGQRSILLDMQGAFMDGQPIPLSRESDIYELMGHPFLPPEVREGRPCELDRSMQEIIPALVSLEDMRGMLHIHTTYSDGRATMEELAKAARERGYSWIGISDHSKSAYYAGGLKPGDLLREFEEIDGLNRTLEGITILKGIESDILADGSLDYPPDILSRFDFVIASIHSQMEMSRTVMTERIMAAIMNPRTSILGHPTGRLLLSRKPYEVDIEAVLEEAARQGVTVELNANPMRMDLDWRLIHGFMERGGRIVITPDAHSVSGLDDMFYGVAMARKGLALKESCLNTYDAWKAREVLAARWK